MKSFMLKEFIFASFLKEKGKIKKLLWNWIKEEVSFSVGKFQLDWSKFIFGMLIKAHWNYWYWYLMMRESICVMIFFFFLVDRRKDFLEMAGIRRSLVIIIGFSMNSHFWDLSFIFKKIIALNDSKMRTRQIYM